MTTTPHQAHQNLFRRAPEEHFESFDALRTSAADQRRRARELEARDLAILFGESGNVYFGDHRVVPTHYSLGQFAQIARVPMPVLSRLKTETWASVLNQCFERTRRFRIGLADGDRLRAVTSDRYERVWDEELYEAIDRWLLPSGFIPAVPTSSGPNALGNHKPALFRSDRDSFAFFYSEKDSKDAFGGLRKGVVVFNSEVGAKCLGYATFLFREVCSNLLIWGATGYCERAARHTSSVRELFRAFDHELRAISNEVSPVEYGVIERAARTPFVHGNDRKAAEARLVREFKVPPKVAPEVIEAVYLPENPGELTHWGVVNRVTSVAKDEPYAAEGVELSRLAGDLLRV